MIGYDKVLSGCPLFWGIGADERERVLRCLDGAVRRIAAGQSIFRAGEPAVRAGVMLEGAAQIIREEYTGERTILARLVPGELFGESFACARETRLTFPITVLSETEGAVLFLDLRRAAASCSSSCAFHARLIANLLGILADKNRVLNRRLDHLSKRTTREKLLSYLSEQAAVQGGGEFCIPYNRQELADYLCVERSAMSAVLGKMRDDGLVRFWKNRFVLLSGAETSLR